MRSRSWAFSAFSLLATFGCGATNAQLQRRAVVELNCQIREQKLVELDARTRIVSGCGRTATYVKDCTPQPWSLSTPCTWRLDSDINPANQAGSEQAPPTDSPENKPIKYADRSRLPEGAVGFDFGMTVDGAEDACTTEGGTWERTSRYFSCTKTPVDTGLPLRSRLGFCGGRLCELILEGALLFEKTDNGSFLQLKNSMLSKYGPAGRIEDPASDRCSSTPVTCVRKENSHYAAVWTFEEGESIEVNLSNRDEAARLAIRYHMMTKGMTLDEQQADQGSEGLDASAF